MEVQHRKCWLAAYTRSRHEHQVANQLRSKDLEFLITDVERTVRWSDRIRRSSAPLFPGYVFVHVSDSERVPVLQTIGVVNLVCIAGKAAVLHDEEVERLRACCSAERHRTLSLSANRTPGAGQARSFRRMGRHAGGKVECAPADYQRSSDHEIGSHNIDGADVESLS